MNLQQLPKTSKFYSRCKKCDIEKTLGGTTPLGSPKVNRYQLETHMFFLKVCRSLTRLSDRASDELSPPLKEQFVGNYM